MQVTLSMLVQRWFSDKLRPLWRIEDIDSNHFTYDQPSYTSPQMLVRIVRLRRPINKDRTGLDSKLPCIQINENQCCVMFNDGDGNMTTLYAYNPEFFNLLDSYINEIEERDSLGIWKQIYEEPKT